LNANNVVELKSLVSGRLRPSTLTKGSGQGRPARRHHRPARDAVGVDQTRSQADGARKRRRASPDRDGAASSERASDLSSANARLLQAQEESKAQPELTRAAIAQARTALASAERERESCCRARSRINVCGSEHDRRGEVKRRQYRSRVEPKISPPCQRICQPKAG